MDKYERNFRFRIIKGGRVQYYGSGAGLIPTRNGYRVVKENSQHGIDIDHDHPHSKVDFFTGIYDDNGNPIFERDILEGKTTNVAEEVKNMRYRVVWSRGGFSVNDPNCCDQCDQEKGHHGPIDEFMAIGVNREIGEKIEVIGNEHENSDLLKKKEEES